MDYNEKMYKQTIEKITLTDAEKEKAKQLFYVASTRRKPEKITKFFKPAIAVACAFAILITSSAVMPNFPTALWNTLTGTKSSNNSCTLTAYAQELTKNGKVYLKHSDVTDCMTYRDYLNTNKIRYYWDFPVICKGDNIDTITYSSNGSAFFQNIYPKGKSLIKDGVKKTLPEDLQKELEQQAFAPRKSRYYPEENKKDYQRYQSFTVDYDCQSRKGYKIQFHDYSDLWEKEKTQEFFEKGYQNCFTDDIDLWSFLTKDLSITCTIAYKDGSTEEKTIRLGCEKAPDEDDDFEYNLFYFYLA